MKFAFDTDTQLYANEQKARAAALRAAGRMREAYNVEHGTIRRNPKDYPQYKMKFF